METIIVHVDKDNCVTLFCPFCGVTKRMSVEKCKNIKHKIISDCKCGNRIKVQLNFRKYYRKSALLTGKFMTLSPNKSIWQKMNVCDLSMTGVGFKMIDTLIIKRGNVLRAVFDLDDSQRTRVSIYLP